MTTPVAADPSQTPPPVSVEQIVAAFAAALLPLAGPAGIAVATLVPALEQLIDVFRNHSATDYTVDDLVAIVQTGDAGLAELIRDRAAQKAAEDAAGTGG